MEVNNENVININIAEMNYRKIAADLVHYFILPKGVRYNFKENFVHFIKMSNEEFEDDKNLYKVVFVDTSLFDINIFSIRRCDNYVFC